MKKISFLFLLVVVLLITGCKRNNNEIVMATEATFPPYEYYSDGKIVGVDVDIMKEVAKELGKKLKVKDVQFDSIISEVKSGKSDVGAAGISYSEERAKQVAFSDSYMDSMQVLVVRNDSKVESIIDLYDKSVAVQLGTVADTYLTDNYSEIKVVREKKFLAAIQDLKDSKVDAVLMDYVPAKEFVDDSLNILEEPVLIDSYSVIVDKSNKDLLQTINKVIKRMKKNGDIDKSLLKHSGD